MFFQLGRGESQMKKLEVSLLFSITSLLVFTLYSSMAQAISVGDTVYIYDSSYKSFWWSSPTKVYMKAYVEDDRSNKIKVRIRERCIENAYGDVACFDRDGDYYNIGDYYWESRKNG
jgi:hypothetical protein